jgi:hypothetical protein
MKTEVVYIKQEIVFAKTILIESDEDRQKQIEKLIHSVKFSSLDHPDKKDEKVYVEIIPIYDGEE